MKAFRGDVGLVDFPFALGVAQKLRPAVVVQDDLYNRKLAPTILAPITSNTKHTSDPTQIAVDPTTAVGSQTGLLRPLAIKCENLATVESRLIRRKIGTASAPLLAELNQALKAALGIYS